MSTSLLVIGRCGATTVAELSALGRPAILIPLPHAKDNDQLENALRLQAAGGAWCIPQAEVTPEGLATRLRHLFEDPTALMQAANRSRALFNNHAVEKLAELMEDLVYKQIAPAPIAAAASA